MVKVILKEDISGLGKCGDVKDVKEGFARNFLLPKNLALMATGHNLKRIEIEHKKRETQKLLEKNKAQELAERLSGLSITIPVEVSDEENLYGSLTAQDIARAISQEGVNVDKKSIILDEPIKKLGIYDLNLRLHSEIIVKMKIWVVKN